MNFLWHTCVYNADLSWCFDIYKLGVLYTPLNMSERHWDIWVILSFCLVQKFFTFQRITYESSTSIDFDLKVDYKMIAIAETKEREKGRRRFGFNLKTQLKIWTVLLELQWLVVLMSKWWDVTIFYVWCNSCYNLVSSCNLPLAFLIVWYDFV